MAVFPKLINSMLNISDIKYLLFFKEAKTSTKKEILEKSKKEKSLLLIPENIGDRVTSVCKTEIPTEY